MLSTVGVAVAPSTSDATTRRAAAPAMRPTTLKSKRRRTNHSISREFSMTEHPLYIVSIDEKKQDGGAS